MFRIYDEPGSPDERGMFQIYDEPESPNDGALLRKTVSRTRRRRGRVQDICHGRVAVWPPPLFLASRAGAGYVRSQTSNIIENAVSPWRGWSPRESPPVSLCENCDRKATMDNGCQTTCTPEFQNAGKTPIKFCRPLLRGVTVALTSPSVLCFAGSSCRKGSILSCPGTHSTNGSQAKRSSALGRLWAMHVVQCSDVPATFRSRLATNRFEHTTGLGPHRQTGTSL